MKVVLLLFVTIATVVKGDITGTDPPSGTCLCFSASNVYILSAACGSQIGTSSAGDCYKYTGNKVGCTLDKYYEFFEFDWKGTLGWAEGTYLNQASDTSCTAAGVGEYTCMVDYQGMRIHEQMSPSPTDCVDSSCGNTCQGGKSVAYVTCECTSSGNWPPSTGCWSPGQYVMNADGSCNRNIQPNTAIATFPGGGGFYGRAAVFIGCQDDYTIIAYEQSCCNSIDYATYPSSDSYYSEFATITSPSCADRTSWPCRVENSGPTCCEESVAGCLRTEDWSKALKDAE